jgi:hypothetical protein
MFRKLTAAVLAFRAVLMIGHGLIWLFVGKTAGAGSGLVNTASSIVSMLSMVGGMVLMTFAYLATRRGKAELSADNAALDEKAGSHASLDFDPDEVMARYLANKSAMNAEDLNAEAVDAEEGSAALPVSAPPPSYATARPEPALMRPARPVFGRKAA